MGIESSDGQHSTLGDLIFFYTDGLDVVPPMISEIIFQEALRHGFGDEAADFRGRIDEIIAKKRGMFDDAFNK